MDCGRGGRSKRGLLEIRRVVRPGKMVGRSLRRVQVVILLREMSRERRVLGNWKVVAGSVVTVLMEFPRIERCSRFGRADRWRKAEIEVISLCSRVSVVMVLGSSHDISES